MYRDLFSNRGFQGSLAFFLLCVGGSLLYSWHIQRTTESDMARHDRFLQALEKQNATRPAQTANVPTKNKPPALVNTPDENTDTPMSYETEALPHDIETLDFADAFLPDETTEENTAGDFPEVPADFPENLTPVWVDFPNYQKGDMHDHEMIYRVLIKLWNQGERGFLNGVFRDNNRRVYPLYPDVLYVEWDDEIVGGPDGPRTIRYPGSVLGTHDRGFTPEEMLSGRLEELYPHLKFVEMETAGYDPETFLTDEEK